MTSPRPRYHFTPPQNFVNDPNGLVFYDGEYHLFYQHNPFGTTWGHMSWGHAVGQDLIHWEHLPVALAEEDSLMMFSGSAVVDWQNTSGFGVDGQPPLVAIYTGHTEPEQNQNIAYSTDRGRTWTKFEGNPVIAIAARDFRDPKVFWHDASAQWIMVTVISDQHKVRFDGSPDLKKWTYLSEFGPAGAIDGQWECPDLFPLSVEGEPDLKKWVLKVDALRGTGAQYFVGEFDGTRFVHEGPTDEILRVDHGEDFYAAQSWNEEPHGRRIWIGWMNNWHYGNEIPTSPWRGLFSIPREIRLQKIAGGYRLIQQPIEEFEQLRKPLFQIADTDIGHVNAKLSDLKLPIAQEIDVQFTLQSASEFGLKLHMGQNENTLIGYDSESEELFVDRRYSGDHSFSDRFAGIHRAALPLTEGKISLHIFLDSCSVEVFGNEGAVVISDLIFPSSETVRLELYTQGGNIEIETLEIWELT